MLEVTTAPVRVSDAAELIAANFGSRDHHAPWASPFTDKDGFDAWFGRTLTGPNRGFVARGNSIIGVVNITEIVWGAFRSAYLSYYSMVGRSAAAS